MAIHNELQDLAKTVSSTSLACDLREDEVVVPIGKDIGDSDTFLDSYLTVVPIDGQTLDCVFLSHFKGSIMVVQKQSDILSRCLTVRLRGSCHLLLLLSHLLLILLLLSSLGVCLSLRLKLSCLALGSLRLGEYLTQIHQILEFWYTLEQRLQAWYVHICLLGWLHVSLTSTTASMSVWLHHRYDP